MGFDLLFFSRDEAGTIQGRDRKKARFSRPAQFFQHLSHAYRTEGGKWFYTPRSVLPDKARNRDCRQRRQKRAIPRELPPSGPPRERRSAHEPRLKGKDGKIDSPNPEGVVMKSLPVVLIKDISENPSVVCFSPRLPPLDGQGRRAELPDFRGLSGAAMARLMHGSALRRVCFFREPAGTQRRVSSARAKRNGARDHGTTWTPRERLSRTR